MLLGVTAADRVFATSKLFFAYALGNALLIPLLARASAYLHPDWPDPAAVARGDAEFAPTLFFSVPTVYARCCGRTCPPTRSGSARLCISAGERLPAEIYDAWRARFGVEILDGIGATETIFMVLSNRPGESRAGSSGVPVPGTEARAPRRGGPAGGRRGGGRALGPDAVAGRRVLPAPRPLAPDVRGRLVPDR